jgi:hypothetical protein
MAMVKNAVRGSTSLRRMAGMVPLALLASGLATGADASLVVSSGATKNVTCARKVCSATAQNAVLNVTTLQTMLAASAVKLVSGSTANDIDVEAALTWASRSLLTLDSYRSIVVNAPVSDTGPGNLTMTTNDGGTGGTLSFGAGGNVTFMGLQRKLTIDGNLYKLADNIKALAADIAANPSGYFALAKSYNAKHDGTYPAAPIVTQFLGTFEGLGNTISNMTIVDGTQEGATDGLFSIAYGTIRDLGLLNASVTSTGDQGANGAGTLVSAGNTIWRCWATGSVAVGRYSAAGGLAAGAGNISQSYANVAVNGANVVQLGGLASSVSGNISQSYAVGPVSDASSNGDFDAIGGLVSETGQGTILSQSYATGPVTLANAGATYSLVGGLLASNNYQSTVTQSYSTGKVTAVPNPNCPSQGCIGGLIGNDTNGSYPTTSAYWDTTTSGITSLSQGAGAPANDPGITGLTNAQFKSGLPSGFDPAVWGEKPGINGHLPYLLALPPS